MFNTIHYTKQGYVNRSIKFLKSYGLSTAEIINVMECIEAVDKYENLPVATKDSLQCIADMHGISFIFNMYKGKLILSGLGCICRCTHLTPLKHENEVKANKIHHYKQTSQVYCNPNANNILSKEFMPTLQYICIDENKAV